MSIILNTDSYKASHYLQYPPEVKFVNSYIESRGGEFDKTLFFGLQAFIKEYLMKPITEKDINEAEYILTAHGLPFNREGWEIILNEHNGFLPIIIEAAPEGLVIPTNNVLVQIRNLDERFPWLPQYIETALLRAVWYPTTVATLSYNIKQIILKYLEKTSDDPKGQIPFKLHDFGSRGVSSKESAGLGGMAHLVNFSGTDTIEALMYARKYYHAEMPAFSIPAAEHSTITSWCYDEKESNEKKAFENMIDKFAKPGSIVAAVSDSYNVYNAVEHLWCGDLLNKVKKSGATIVIRPDSGNPEYVLRKIFNILEEKLKDEIVINSKGFKVLPSYFKIIQGDGVNIDTIEDILLSMYTYGWSADNIAFGMGGALLQGVNRDTLKFAQKASAVYVDNSWKGIFKNPITDNKKVSKKGILKLTPYYKTVQVKPPNDSILEVVFINGFLTKEYTFEEVRQNSLK